MFPRRALAVAATLALTPACGSKTGLADEPFTSPVLICADSAWRVRPGATLRIYANVPRYAFGRTAWEVVSAPPGAAATVTPVGHDAANFTAAIEGTYDLRVSVPPPPTPTDGGVTSCLIRVVVRASGPVAICPAEVVTAPLQSVAVNASAQGDRAITSTEWTVVSAPAPSARPAPRPDDRAATRYTPDVAGDYVLQLVVTDTSGARDTCTTRVRAVPREGLRVELAWDPPGRSCPTNEGAACDESDVDLHLLRASSGAGWRSDDDCHWQNCNASAGRTLAWGASGAADDPRLDLDDVRGHGPENINIERPSARSYRVGVHYFNNHQAGDQAATVVIYCGSSEPVARFGPVTLVYGGAPDPSSFWIVADVLPTPGGCEVRPITRDGRPWITTYGEAQRSPGPPAP